MEFGSADLLVLLPDPGFKQTSYPVAIFLVFLLGFSKTKFYEFFIVHLIHHLFNVSFPYKSLHLVLVSCNAICIYNFHCHATAWYSFWLPPLIALFGYAHCTYNAPTKPCLECIWIIVTSRYYIMLLQSLCGVGTNQHTLRNIISFTDYIHFSFQVLPLDQFWWCCYVVMIYRKIPFCKCFRDFYLFTIFNSATCYLQSFNHCFPSNLTISCLYSDGCLVHLLPDLVVASWMLLGCSCQVMHMFSQSSSSCYI